MKLQLVKKETIMAKVKSINHIAFAVKDFNAAIENAIQVLGGEMMMEFESIEDSYKKENLCPISRFCLELNSFNRD